MVLRDPGPTQPNRAYGLAGTSDSLKVKFHSKALLREGFAGRTIFEMLPNTVTWKAYSHDISGLRSSRSFARRCCLKSRRSISFLMTLRMGRFPSLLDRPGFGIAVYPGPPMTIIAARYATHTELVSRVYNALLKQSQLVEDAADSRVTSTVGFTITYRPGIYSSR